PRKHYTAEEKVAILRRHLLEKEPISKLCDDIGPRSFTAGKRSSSRTAPPPSSRRRDRTTQPSRSESPTWRRRSKQGRGPRRGDGGAHRAKKRDWGTLIGVWVPHDTRDQIVDFVRRWSDKTEIGAGRFIGWLDITASKFYDWRDRYGKVNEHN